jgi:hypothetical protein
MDGRSSVNSIAWHGVEHRSPALAKPSTIVLYGSNGRFELSPDSDLSVRKNQECSF